MIFKSDFERSREIGNFEAIYESFDSSRFLRCECEFVNPMFSKESGARMNELAKCDFYDAYGKIAGSIQLTNIEALALCEAKKGISILLDKYAIVPSYLRNETKCVDLCTNEVLWKSPINRLTKVFVYQDKIFCEWSSSSGGLSLISAKSGRVVKNIFKYKVSGDTLTGIAVDRLNEYFLLAYDNGYMFAIDMRTDDVLFLKVAHKLDNKYFNLCGITRTDGSRDVELRFKYFVTTGPLYLGGEAKWVVEDIKANIDDLLKACVQSPFGKNIPADKRQLEKAYIEAFGRENK